MKKSDFNYHLPKELIAQIPLPVRSASRLLCVDIEPARLFDRQFSDFIDQINANDLLVFNNTRVIPARLYGVKATGGRVEILIERLLDNNHALAHIKASKSPKANTIINLDGGYNCKVLGRNHDLFEVQFLNITTINELLADIGHIPLPPYIDRDDNTQDRSRYQTIYAQQDGAVAAPTAGLHFDQALFDQIADKGIQTCYVTLHVGSGTFQPVRVEDLDQHLMHKEYFDVDQQTVDLVNSTRKNGGRVIAVGTTSVRALESASTSGVISVGFGDTDLFITPGYQFYSVDAILTNFHLPESTLLMLVSAFAGHDLIKHSYQHAIDQAYRFFSYGDAMLLQNPKLLKK